MSLHLSVTGSFVQTTAADKNKKTGVPEHPKAFEHAGLLVNEPPDTGGLPLI